MTTKFLALKHLLQAYLNQDWPDDYATVWDAVDEFKRSDPARVELLRREVAELIAEGRDEEGLKLLLVDELGGEYWPPGDGSTFSDWLLALKAALE